MVTLIAHSRELALEILPSRGYGTGADGNCDHGVASIADHDSTRIASLNDMWPSWTGRSGEVENRLT
jgi:hypothetical protein